MKKDITSALDSTYIIDGIRMDLTPRQILQAASVGDDVQNVMEDDEEPEGNEPVVDESADPIPYHSTLSVTNLYRYAKDVSELADKASEIPAASSADISRLSAAQAIIDTLWRCGHFRVSDLVLNAEWQWDFSNVGSYAAFYSSVESTCWYTDMMGIRLSGYSLAEGGHSLHFSPSVAGGGDGEGEDPDDLFTDPFTTTNPVMEEGRRCPDAIVGNPDNWLIYIPFDTCPFRLGGSLLEEAEGIGRGKAPEIGDTDYFMDCFEVVREFVEDGIVLSGRTVGRGGLMTALKGLCPEGIGADIELGIVMQSYGENDLVNILFSEVPGVVIEINPSDFDYVDAELLLQDVAYYPLGHPDGKTLRISGNPEGGISGIIQSLIDSHAPEGED